VDVAETRPSIEGARALRCRRSSLASAAVVLATAVLCSSPAFAHALDPVLFQLTERADGLIDVTWKAPNARVPGLALAPVFPSECHRVENDGSAPPSGDGSLANVLQVQQSETDEQDASITHWTVRCDAGLVGRTIGIDGLESTDALVRIRLRSGSVDRRVLGADRSRITVKGEPTRGDVFIDYARLGIEHITGAIDHLLFVLGLMLLATNARALLAMISAFTAGHCVTLAAAALQLVSVSQAPIEVIIAVTIWILAVELSRRVGARATLLRRRPWAMSFTFGLLHGLGFAGALKEAGLPSNDVPLALLSFNVGIEIGQVGFVTAVLAAMGAMRATLEGMPPWARALPVFGMGTAATYWILVRVSPLL